MEQQRIDNRYFVFSVFAVPTTFERSEMLFRGSVALSLSVIFSKAIMLWLSGWSALCSYSIGSECVPYICDQNVVGNEIHYVMFCSNKLMVEEREFFFRDIYKINTLLQVLDLDSLFYYILSMKDENIIKLKRSSDYCLRILEIYDLESSNLG